MSKQFKFPTKKISIRDEPPRHGHYITFDIMARHKTPKKINSGLDSEFNSIHFGIEINKSLKFLRPKNFWGFIY